MGDSGTGTWAACGPRGVHGVTHGSDKDTAGHVGPGSSLDHERQWGLHLARAEHSLVRRGDDTGVTSTWLHGITVIAVATQNTTQDTHTALGRPALTPPACWGWELDEGVMALGR